MVCLIVIALAMIIFAMSSIVVASEMKKLTERLVDVIGKVEREIIPLAAEARMVVEDVRSVTTMTRAQLEKVESSINSVTTMVGGAVKTVNYLRCSILSPFTNVIATVKGVCRGVEYFLTKK